MIHSSDNLDISWLNEYSSINDIHEQYCREPMKEINVFFVYINEHSYIEKIINEKHGVVETAVEGGSAPRYIIPKEHVLHMIQSKKISTPYSKYKLMDTLVYNVDLESDHIQSYSKLSMNDQNNKQFFRVLTLIDDIVLPPSIFIFHSLNSVFFIFQEYVHTFHKPPSAPYGNDGVQSLTYDLLRNSGSLQPEVPIKPILKKTNVDEHGHLQKHTKKVRITIPEKDTNQPRSARHTRKNIIVLDKTI
jgi:hypothetical protein